MTSFVTCLISASVLLTSTTCLAAQADKAQAGERPLRIGIVYRESPSGQRMLAGIDEAIERYNTNSSRKRFIETERLSYSQEEAGLETLLRAIHRRNATVDPADPMELPNPVDVILGPSDSGVFLSLNEFEEVLDRQKIVVFSPVVNAAEGNRDNGWLFRANVTVKERARRIIDQLLKQGFMDITIVYENSGFGDRAELAFRNIIKNRSGVNYQALRYRAGELPDLALSIEADRPGAVGLLGRVEHMTDLYDSLRRLSHPLRPYNPLLFTIDDASTLCLEDVRFVTVSSNAKLNCSTRPSLMQDESSDLGFDTANHLLRVVDFVLQDPTTDGWRERFRNRLVATLDGSDEAHERTRMTFVDMENTANPVIRRGVRVLTNEHGNNVFSFETVDVNPEGWQKFQTWWKNRWDVRQRQFGIMPLLNLLLVAVIVAGQTFIDVSKSYTGNSWRLFQRWPFQRLVAFNVSLAVAVLFFLAEFGDVRWDNWLAALTVAFGYTVLLKATIFETPTGKTIGLAGIYEGVLKKINKQLKMLRYEVETPRIYFLSYSNSRSTLRDTLERVYRESEGSDKAKARIEELDSAVNAVDGAIEKRRIYALELLDLMNWAQLVRARLVPHGMKERDLYDPTSLLLAAARYCTHTRPERQKKIDALVDHRMSVLEQNQSNNKLKQNKPLEAERSAHKPGGNEVQEAKEVVNQHAEELARLKKAVEKCTTERGRTYQKLDWLVVQQQISLEDIWDYGFVDSHFDPRPLRSRLLALLRVPQRRAANDRTLEQRIKRRIPGTGTAIITWQEKGKDKEPQKLKARVVDVSVAGIGLELEPDSGFEASYPQANYTIAIEDGPLKLESAADCRASNQQAGCTRLNLKWFNLPKEALTRIVAYISEYAAAHRSQGVATLSGAARTAETS